MKKFAVLVLALALCVGAFAQGRRGMQMGGGPNMLLRRHDVQKDLGLTDDQKNKLDTIREKMQSDMRELFQANQGSGERPDFEKMRPQMEKLQADSKKEIDAILTADQQKRLFEIFVQMEGNRAVLNPDVQNQIGLTDAQKTQIKDLMTKEREAQQQIMEKMRNGEISREQIGDLRKKNQGIMATEIDKILTADQKAKLAALGGKPFTKDPDEGNGGFGGKRAA